MSRDAFVLLLCACFAFVHCALGREVELTFLHTTDLHGRIFPTEDYDGRSGVGGILRCASKIQSVRAEKSNVVLLDCGDFIQGSPESYVTQGDVMVKAMEWLNYDAVVVGNHEFDWGYDFFIELISSKRLPLLGGNILRKVEPVEGLSPFKIIERDGVRIAIVGLTTPGMPGWFRPEFLEDLHVEGSVKSMRSILPSLRAANPDITVLIAHQGYPAYGRQLLVNELNKVGREVPVFDLILGGHTHNRVVSESLGGALYAQAGYFGIWLGEVNLVFDTVQRKVVRRHSQLHDIDEKVVEEPRLLALLEPALEQIKAELAQPVGSIAEAFETEEHSPGHSAVQQLICCAIAAKSGADFVIHGHLNEDAGLAKGEVKNEQLWGFVPYDNLVGLSQLTSRDLRDILEENLGFLGGHHFKGVWGLSYVADLEAQPGQRITSLRQYEGEALHSRKRYLVAMNSFDLASGGWRFPRLREIVDEPDSRLEMQSWIVRDLVREYLKKHKDLKPVIKGSAIIE